MAKHVDGTRFSVYQLARLAWNYPKFDDLQHVSWMLESFFWQAQAAWAVLNRGRDSRTRHHLHHVPLLLLVSTR